MKHPLRRSAVAICVLILASASAFAQVSDIQLVQGKRAVSDSVSFTVEIARERNENPRYAKMPEFIELRAMFARPASGFILVDGKGVVRFDETFQVRSNRTEISYGRHVVTLRFAAPAVVTQLMINVPGGALREVIEEVSIAAPSAAQPPDARVVDLERRVKQLEAEVEALKKGRRAQQQ